jgi:predicted acyl esterase
MLNLTTPWNIGVPDGHLSGLEKFEALDPAEWIPRGYAIISADTRGAGDSDGPVVIMGTQEGEDGYDVIEALAKMPWCNGAVGMVGNSHLAITQYFVAAQVPPSLKAIAPWEAASDLFREQFGRGGMWNGAAFDWITDTFIQGRHGMENFAEMYRRSRGLRSPYWDDKRAALEKIKIPTYVTGSFSSPIHPIGSIRAWMQIASENKWFRICPWQEWYDLWVEKESADELQAFFDRYLKGIANGWEKTPKVRVTTLKFGDRDPELGIVVADFPLPQTKYIDLFLDSNQSLSYDRPGQSGVSSHDSKTRDRSSFNLFFDSPTRLLGLPKAILYVSSPDADDMDVFVQMRKLDAQGKQLLALNIPWSRAPIKAMTELQPKDMSELILYEGPVGMLRASHREIDPSQSMHPQYPFHPHTQKLPVPPGEIIELEIGMWPLGIDFEAGEGIEVNVSGRLPGVAMFADIVEDRSEVNVGLHTVHFGGANPSRIILPFVPL